MKVLFLTDNFPPEFNAPATRTYEHCKEWVKQGVEVTVVTCAPNFPEGKIFEGYKNKWYQKDVIDGINVIRVWTYIAANKGFLKRIIDFLSFMIMSFWAGLFIKTDIIVATSPQFFTAVSGRWLSFWKRKPWVMEVRDIWPESIRAVGAMDRNLIIRFFEYLELHMYKSAWRIIVVTDSFKEQLINERGVSEEKIKVVKNGINTTMFKPIPKNEKLLKELGLTNKFIVGYIGTHGMAHKLDFILECASKIENEKFHFLFLGTGAEKDNLMQMKDNLGLKNVTMLPPVEKREVKKYISILDVALVNLKKSDTFKSVLPSKIFELSGMHKPILLGVEGESKKLIEDYGIGCCFEPENIEDFLEKLHLIETNKIKSNAFEKIILDFDRSNLAKQMLLFLGN
ncbi:glycosyltransferase family 4 protein [Flagellimonas sp. HMM57]|uniref:glycosyltransferase family 4 protein n=1 Tax=unclassified Flagellimonas TaxID=2644544 RepID=UPI0013D69EE4|nr:MULTISPECIES: glycosyltransferase family 4 protein [unclassified Flagellimonas]UII77595.1 glycosyltransferase family 4 protein [Flagellimonas sp. HMM57]